MIDYAAAARAYEEQHLARTAGFGDLGSDMDSSPHRESPLLADRPVNRQAPPDTDGLDPAALGGPAPMNSGQGPYGNPVVEDPMLSDPIRPGAPIPHVTGPDVDATVLT